MGWLTEDLFDMQEDLKLRQKNKEIKESSKEGVLYEIKQTKSTINFNSKEIKSLLGPIVYVYWQLETEYKIALYVGQSSLGISRPLGNDHHHRKNLELADTLEIIYCDNPEEAAKLETELIKFLKPSLNSRRNKAPRKVSLKV